jgi:hypothetical protein
LRRAAAVLLAFMSTAPPAVAGALEVHGRVKLQSSLRLFRHGDLGALIAGSHPIDGLLDLRLDTTWREARWDLTVNTEVTALDGDSVAVLHSPLTDGFGGFLLGLPPPEDDHRWFDFSHTFSSTDNRLVLGRFDRLSVGYTGDRFVMRLGRQALSWGGGLVFQVLDLFNPFPPNVIDTDYKPGTDMLTTQWLLAGGDDLQAIVVPRRAGPGRGVTADESSMAVKWHHFAGSTELELMGARHYGDTIGGAGASGNLAGGVWRANLTVTSLSSGALVTSLLANLDHSWVWGGRNAYGFAEYFRSGFGVTSLDRDVGTLPAPLLDRLARGELFNLGRDELATGLQFQWTPRLTLDPTVIVNLDDRSSMLLLKVGFDWLQNVKLDAGVQVGEGPHGTEYGGVHDSVTGAFLAPGQLLWVKLSRYF